MRAQFGAAAACVNTVVSVYVLLRYTVCYVTCIRTTKKLYTYWSVGGALRLAPVAIRPFLKKYIYEYFDQTSYKDMHKIE